MPRLPEDVVPSARDLLLNFTGWLVGRLGETGLADLHTGDTVVLVDTYLEEADRG